MPDLDDDMRFYIFCNECATKINLDDAVFMLAMFGPQGLGDEDACLVCGPYNGPLGGYGYPVEPFSCDGCKTIVAVSPSSKWFIELHRSERE